MAHSLQRVGIGTLLLCGIGAVLLGLGVLLLDIAPGLRWLLLLLVGMLWTGLCLWRWRRRVRAYIEQWLPGVLERLGRVSGGALAVRFSEAEFPEELRALAAELNRLTGAVEMQLSRVRTLERSHTELLGTLAHELRNPLFLLRGSVETALDSSDPPPSESTYCRNPCSTSPEWSGCWSSCSSYRAWNPAPSRSDGAASAWRRCAPSSATTSASWLPSTRSPCT
jgi:signal transduction histidine kinase